MSRDSRPTRGAERRRIVIMGAAGRDFHNFNLVYRDDPSVEVVAFTAGQLPGIAGRVYPAALAGAYYPNGIPILPESELENLCRDRAVDTVVFAYSDVSHRAVMTLAERALATGATFELLGPDRTMLASRLPVIAVNAVRTGCGKSPVSRWIARRIRGEGRRVAILKHPMPYGDLASQRVQRFASSADLEAAHCTHEEREEYEPLVKVGIVVYAGVDYAEILARAEEEADILIWDGGNNDLPFLRPDLSIVVADALRPDHASSYYPSGAVARRADIFVVNKVDVAPPQNSEAVIAELASLNPEAVMIRGASPVWADQPELVRGKRVIIVEDAPSLTHGGLPYGAGFVAANTLGAAAIVDPRLSAPSAMLRVFERYPQIGRVMPAIGYLEGDRQAVAQTIAHSDADLVVVATPLDLSSLMPVDKPVVRVFYDYADIGEPTLGHQIDAFLSRLGSTRSSLV